MLSNPLSLSDPRGLQSQALPLLVIGGLVLGGIALQSANQANPKPKDDGLPGAANDSGTSGSSNSDTKEKDCPPDCQEWKMALDRMYHAIQAAEAITGFDPSGGGSSE